VYDKLNDRSIVLTDEDMSLVHAIQRNRFPAGVNPYEDFREGPIDGQMPLTGQMPSKKTFLGRRYNESDEKVVSIFFLSFSIIF
jgi:hypothetical protein